MTNKALATIVLVIIGLLVAVNSLYIVSETQRAVKLRFGKVVEADIAPGLHVKMPFADSVRRFDARILTVDGRAADFLNAEKKGMKVDSFVKWRIADVSKFYTATGGSTREADRAIQQRVNSGLRDEFGKRTLQEVVSGERDELMSSLIESLDGVVKRELGVTLIDIRVKRIDLPDEVSGSVFNRMRTGREREAREHRSKGKEQAEIIRAEADRERVVIEANAYKQSELLRGEGDAKAAATYAAAYNQDSEFYSFVRSLEAYRATFSNKGDVMLVDPDGDFFRYMKDAGGRK